MTEIAVIQQKTWKSAPGEPGTMTFECLATGRYTFWARSDDLAIEAVALLLVERGVTVDPSEPGDDEGVVRGSLQDEAQLGVLGDLAETHGWAVNLV
jgi:hypothetical protein